MNKFIILITSVMNIQKNGILKIGVLNTGLKRQRLQNIWKNTYNAITEL